MARYLSVEHPEQGVGDWVDDVDQWLTEGEVEGEFTRHPDGVRRHVRAGYWGLITQIDVQVNRLMEAHGELTLQRFGMWQPNHWVTDGHAKFMWWSGDRRARGGQPR